jgi:hypothetical protein
LENTFVTAGVWGLWGQNVAINQILETNKVLCYASKWFGKKDITFVRHDEPHFLSTIHSQLDAADAVVTFNGRKHDIPLLNRELIKGGYNPPSPYKQVDLIETAKKQFKWPSNKLDWILQELGLGKKLEHEGFPLWIKVMKDDPKAWKEMEKYNIADTVLTEKLYKKLLPWLNSHPNRNLYGKVGVCPTCGGTHLQRRGYYRTQTQMYSRLHCQSCGAWSRTRFTEVDKQLRKGILVGAA